MCLDQQLPAGGGEMSADDTVGVLWGSTGLDSGGCCRGATSPRNKEIKVTTGLGFHESIVSNLKGCLNLRLCHSYFFRIKMSVPGCSNGYYRWLYKKFLVFTRINKRRDFLPSFFHFCFFLIALFTALSYLKFWETTALSHNESLEIFKSESNMNREVIWEN